jgi:radical SAM superfamily enzyme YgiQ (UPF0313 family)
MYNVIFFTDHTDELLVSLPLGAFKVAHILRNQGYSCLVVGNYSSFTVDDFKNLIESAVGDETFLIGFSTTFLNQIDVWHNRKGPPKRRLDQTIFPQGKDFENTVIKMFRNRNNKIKTVAGGATMSAEYSNKNIDYVCIGYSESSIVNLANHLTKNTPLENSYKNIWGRVIVDDRLAKSYNFQQGNMVWLPEDIVNFRALPLEVARGCIFQCKFCSFPMNGKKKLDFVKDMQILRQELEYNYETLGIDHYGIVDDTFNDHEEKLVAFRDMVQQLKFKPKFWCYARLDLIAKNPKTLPLLYDIGIRAMTFGIESLNPSTAKIVGKGIKSQRLIDTVKLIKQNYPDISMHGSFIVGLPYESEASVRNTIKLVETQQFPLDSWTFQALRIFKLEMNNYPSDIDKNYKDYGYTLRGEYPNSSYYKWQNEHMNSDRAIAIEIEVLEKANYNSCKMQGQFAMLMHGMNSLRVPQFDFDQLRASQLKDIDFFKFNKILKSSHLKNYKKKLFDLIKSKQSL